MNANANIADRILHGDIRTLSRLITKIENNDENAIQVLKDLYEHMGGARVIGLTGSPGSGKSTIINNLIREYLSRGLRVAVIAVDPTSEFTGGGVLGDRVRMPVSSENLYIRSFGSRGHLGGLNKVCGSVIRLLDAAGYSRIIVETVGTGQSEIEIRNYADTVVVVATPNQGDDIQALKAGILEIGDIFAVNKADLPNAERTVSDLIKMTHMLAGIFIHSQKYSGAECSCEKPAKSKLPSYYDRRIPPVLKVTAIDGNGIMELTEAIEEHYEYLVKNNLLLSRHIHNVEKELSDNLVKLWAIEYLGSLKGSDVWSEICLQVANGELNPWTATEMLWDLVRSKK